MSYNIILNRNNVTNLNQGNNKLSFQFAKTTKFKEGDTLALTHLNIFLSWFNVSSMYNNNKFSYSFWDLSGNKALFSVTIDDGFYNNETFYEAFQAVLVERGHFLESQDGLSRMFFVGMRSNITFYADSFIFYSVSAGLYDFEDGSGPVPITDVFKTPTTWALPIQYECMEIIFPNT